MNKNNKWTDDMKWVSIFIILCLLVAPAMSEELQEVLFVDEVSENSDANSELSEKNVRALIVFNVLLEELDMMAGNVRLDSTTEGDLTSRLADVLLGEGDGIQSEVSLMQKLMNSAISNTAAYSGDNTEDECYECDPSHTFDTAAMLFYLASNIMNDDQEDFADNLAYLKDLISQMEKSANPEYIAILNSAVTGWEGAYGILDEEQIFSHV